MDKKIHLTNKAGEKLTVEQSEFYEGKYEEWMVDFDWYYENGYVTLDEFAMAVGVKYNE